MTFFHSPGDTSPLIHLSNILATISNGCYTCFYKLDTEIAGSLGFVFHYLFYLEYGLILPRLLLKGSRTHLSAFRQQLSIISCLLVRTYSAYSCVFFLSLHIFQDFYAISALVFPLRFPIFSHSFLYVSFFLALIGCRTFFLFSRYILRSLSSSEFSALW